VIRNACLTAVFAVSLTVAINGFAIAQPVPGGLCRPVQERTADVGCWILGHIPVGQFTTPSAAWYLHTFKDRASAEANKGPRGVVVEAFNKVWLFSAEETGWKGPGDGELRLVIGPLPVASAADYSAQFMESVFTPGMTSAAHVHSGPEAFYTLEGETCLETPAGMQLSQSGGPAVIIPDGPMHLTATGTALRRGFALILHRTGQPATTRIHDWTPKQLCKARQS
jgi:quercetin dioxygenase-like cupin family protein